MSWRGWDCWSAIAWEPGGCCEVRWRASLLGGWVGCVWRVCNGFHDGGCHGSGCHEGGCHGGGFHEGGCHGNGCLGDGCHRNGWRFFVQVLPDAPSELPLRSAGTQRL